ncbi:HEAT repeat domain-containing protein [Microseira wollei]|uniref:HEAT repeat domain-containing protein n=1 Tax=Microseira wollei TaxID=467598 RepID=UPI001CFE563B|nr:HEAT repeat domain-containing protein [Microseira wollei]
MASSEADSQEQQKRPEQFAVLEGLRKYASEHVLLVGKPGSGKSTSLRRLLWEEAGRCLEAIEQGNSEIPPIPILIELRGLSGLVLAAIQEKLGWWLDLDEKTLKALLRDRQLFVFLDGLNELPNEQAWQAVDEFRQVCAELKVPLIITTRELGSGLVQGNVKKLEMLPLTEPQMREFVCKQLPETGEELWRQIQGKLRELAETPLLLKLLCDVFEQNGQIPKSRGDLFRKEFARRYEEFKPERYRNISEDSRRFAFDLLSYLAFTMVQGEPHTDPCQPSASWITIPKTQAEKILATFLAGDRTPDVAVMSKAKEWLEDLLEWHLLQIASTPTHIEFHHQLFQEYYAAEWLAPQLAELSDEELKNHYLNYLKWTEPLAMSMSFVESDPLAVRMVKLALDVDLYLGARLTGEATISLQQETVNVLLQKNFQPSLTIWLLEQTQSHNALPFLLDVLKNGCSDTRWRATRSLGNFANVEVLKYLIEALKDKDSSVRQKAVESLGKLGNSEVIPHLCQLDDENFLVRSIVVEVLGELEGRAAIDCLKSALQHEDYTVKTKAAEYLGQRVPQEVIALLNEEFNSGNADPKKDDLQLLGHTKNDAAIPLLIRALSESDWIVRSEAVSQIGLLGIWLNSDVLENAVTALINIMQDDPETSVRSSAALHLGFIGDSRAIPVLIEALSKDDLVVRSSVADALGRLQDRSAISALTRSLQDEDYVSEAAIRSLRILNAVESLPALRKLLQSKTIKVRREVIFTLGFIGESKDLSNLYKAWQDKEFSIRVYAAYSLSQLNNRKGIPILEDALKTGNKDAREVALGGLQNFKGKVGLSSIITTALEDDEYSIRKKAVEFIENFKESQEVVNQLKIALHSPNEDICRNAMDAVKTLGNAEVLSRLRQLAETITVVERPLEGISSIQSRCQFYNYDIAQLTTPRKNERGGDKQEDLVHNKLNILTQEVKKVSEEPKRVINTHNYFEQGTHTHTHNYANDETLKQQTIELRQLVNQIQQTHQPTTEVEAAEIIDVEFREIKKTNPTRWQTIQKQLQLLKRQLLNPKSHFKATKATIAEVAKHYLEESVVSKALITYLDTMSADSD